jgi:hypothetical protein
MASWSLPTVSEMSMTHTHVGIRCGLIVSFLLLAAVTHAQTRPCDVTVTSRPQVSGGTRMIVRYELDSPTTLCRVTFSVLRAGQPYPDKVDALGNIDVVPLTLANKTVTLVFDGDVNPSSIEHTGNVITFRFEQGAAQPVTIRFDATGMPAAASRQVLVGGSWFGSLEARQSTPSIGQQQAAGLAARVAFPNVAVRGLELGVEFDFTTRAAIDSELFALASERRDLTDHFFMATVGHEAHAGRRLTFAPVGGFGLSMLETRRFRYSQSGGAVAIDETSATASKPVVTVGADLRVKVASRLRVVGGYRLRAVMGGEEGLLHRSAQHRVSIGVQILAGGLQ